MCSKTMNLQVFTRSLSLGLILLTLCALALPALANRRGENELNLTAKETGELKRFERHELERADKTFAKGKYKQASAEYNVFIASFPDSIAVPYALLRRARALEHQGRVHQAIRDYEEIIKYYPNRVRYAAAAMYYKGRALHNIRDVEKAMVTFSKMVQDKEYAKEPFAADALNRLASYMVSKKREAEAMAYYRQVAVDFRTKNRDSANNAKDKFIEYYTRKAASESELRKFYTDIGGFDRDKAKVPADLEADKRYWDRIRDRVWAYGKFKDMNGDQAKAYYGYWAGQMADRFPDWDDFRIDQAKFKRFADDNNDAYVKSVDAVFIANKKSDDNYSRILRFITAFKGYPNKVQEYYQKLDFKKMNNNQIFEALRVIAQDAGEIDIAKSVARRFKWEQMQDKQLMEIAAYSTRFRDDLLVELLYNKTIDGDLGKSGLLSYYYGNKRIEKGLNLANELTNSPTYSGRAYYIMGEFKMQLGKYEEAISAYRNADNPPQNIIRIAECYMKLKQPNKAMAQYAEIEQVFDERASWAAMRIADILRDSDRKPAYVAKLREIVKMYEKTREASDAHLRLEKMGLRIGGGASNQ